MSSTPPSASGAAASSAPAAAASPLGVDAAAGVPSAAAASVLSLDSPAATAFGETPEEIRRTLLFLEQVIIGCGEDGCKAQGCATASKLSLRAAVELAKETAKKQDKSCILGSGASEGVAPAGGQGAGHALRPVGTSTRPSRGSAKAADVSPANDGDCDDDDEKDQSLSLSLSLQKEKGGSGSSNKKSKRKKASAAAADSDADSGSAAATPPASNKKQKKVHAASAPKGKLPAGWRTMKYKKTAEGAWKLPDGWSKADFDLASRAVVWDKYSTLLLLAWEWSWVCWPETRKGNWKQEAAYLLN